MKQAGADRYAVSQANRWKAERDAARQELRQLKKDVEGRLMPEGMEWLVEAWPRFEDDAPVRLLDDFERYGDENVVSAVTMYSDGSFALNCRAYSKGEHVNRPAPKVLDADGVEIRVGDVLYRKSDGRMVKVAEVYEKTFTDADDCVRPGDGVTHRAPVLAADGRPLREGETVWSVDSGTRYTVEKITDELIPIKCCSEMGSTVSLEKITDELIPIKCCSEMGSTVSLHPSQLTHERPDSWERLEEDAGKSPCDYFGFDGDETCGKCPASAKNCEQTMARDLVRRAKALAGGA